MDEIFEKTVQLAELAEAEGRNYESAILYGMAGAITTDRVGEMARHLKPFLHEEADRIIVSHRPFQTN